jgi:hypothetical protein
VLVSVSGGDERSEPESAICPVSQVDLHGRAEGAAAVDPTAEPWAPPPPFLV